MAGVTVSLLQGATTLQTTATDANGNYWFYGVEDGTYTVRIDSASLPTGATGVEDPDGGTANESSVTITAAADDLDQDFGYSLSNTVFGNIWQDFNADGLQGTGDTALAGISVYLYDSGDNLIASTTSDAAGNYRFDQTSGSAPIGDGDYYVSTSPGVNLTQTADPDTSFDNRTDNFSMAGGGLYGGYDCGYHQAGTGAITGQLFYDWNGSATVDASDEGIRDITVSLYYDANGNGVYDATSDPLVAQTSTATDGTYSFSGLQAGDYLVVVEESDTDFPTDVQQTKATPTAVVTDSTTTTNVDFGYQPVGTAALSGTVWYDKNGDQIQSGTNEVGLASVKVDLYVDANQDGIYVLVRTTDSDSNGNYAFEDLMDGSYRVSVDKTDVDIPVDSNGDSYQLTTPEEEDVAISGGLDASVDFGLATFASIGDRIYYDANNNASMDLYEQGIANVRVWLKDSGGAIIQTVFTSDGTGGALVGSYLFRSLPPGTYTVEVDTSTLPAGITGADQTEDPDRDGVPASDLSIAGLPAADNQYTTVVNYGDNLRGVDFGYQPSGVVGDYVWWDSNGDGIQDAGEFGLQGVTVTATSGATTLTTTTDSDGLYSFQSLSAGTWTIAVDAGTLPSSMTPTASGSSAELLAGTGSVGALSATITIDSAGNVTEINSEAVSDGSLKVDFGFQRQGDYSLTGQVAIEDSLLIDGTANDASDAPVSNLTVYLYNSTGEYIGSTVTDSEGRYHFTNLVEDTYYVALATNSPLLDNAQLTTTAADTPASAIADNGTTVYQTVSVSAAVAGNDGGSDSLAVEGVDFAFRSLIDYDYGDLPDTYRTSTATSPIGARHTIDGAGLYLGSTPPDAESNAVPSTAADSDGTDEDGVTPTNLVQWADGSGNGRVSVVVNGTGWLVGWIDFNGDGDFGDTGEMVISQQVSTGTVDINFDIPAGSIDGMGGDIYARFRLFAEEPTVAALAYSGTAEGGEVEDYQWTIPARQVTIGNASVNEGGVLDFTVSINELSNADIVLDLQAVSQTATAGSDFSSGNWLVSIDGGSNWLPAGGTNGTEVTVPSGQTSVLVRIDSQTDALIENAEYFTLQVASVISGAAGDVSDTGTGAIFDTSTLPAPPTIDLNGGQTGTGYETTFSASGSAVAIAGADVTIEDADDIFMESATITLSNPQTGDQLVLPDTWPGSLSGAITNTSGVITIEITGTGSLAEYQAAIASITFKSTELIPVTTPRTIDIQVNDGDFDSNIATTTINIVVPPPSISIDDIVVDEAAGTATLTVTLTRAASGGETVDFTTFGSTALAGSDYTADAGTVTFASGETEKTITISITNDSVYEGSEILEVHLANPSGLVISDDIGTITIVDDGRALSGGGTANDDRPTLSTSDVVVTEGTDTYAVSTFTLSNTSVSPMEITLSASTGTADAGDFGSALQYSLDGGTTWQTVPGDGKVMLPAGGSSLQVRTTITDDTDVEGSEQFTISASMNVDGRASSVDSTVTILDNDATASTIFVSIDDIVVDEAAGTATLTVTLSQPATGGETVDFTTFDSTALAASDYTADAGTVTFASGETEKTITIIITNDLVYEGSELLEVHLANPSGLVISDDIGTITIVDDGRALSGGGTANDDRPTLSTSDVVVTEGTDTYSVSTFTLSNTSASPIEITLSASTGTADAGDFGSALQYSLDGGTTWLTVPGDGKVTLPAGSSSLQVRTTIADDTDVEGSEQFTISASMNVDGRASSVDSTVMILDNDIATWTWTVSEYGQPPQIVITLDQTPESGQQIVIDLCVGGIPIDALVDDALLQAVQSAIAEYNAQSYPGSLQLVANRLTFFADGTGPMSPLLVDLSTDGGADRTLSIFKLCDPGSPTGAAVGLLSPPGRIVPQPIVLPPQASPYGPHYLRNMTNDANWQGVNDLLPPPGGRQLSFAMEHFAAEPLFSGSARPGTQIVARIYASNGMLLAESTTFSDVGGNWMMQIHGADTGKGVRIEFCEVPGSGSIFDPAGDIYGDLGLDTTANGYSTLQPWTDYERPYDFTAVYHGRAEHSLRHMHHQNRNPVGLFRS